MELLGFKLFEKKPPEQSPQPTVAPAETKLIPIDEQLAGHQAEIEQSVSQALGVPHQPGSSVPAANTIPGNPLMVIQGVTKENELIARQKEIAATLPKDYDTVKTGFGNAWDRNLLGKDGMTGPDEFLAKQAERDAAKKAVQQQIDQDQNKAA